MVRQLVVPVAAALLGATTVLADQATCSLTQKCPKESPCCSQYGQCGVGAYCLGGCDPRMSYSLDACVPAPVCQNKIYPMNSLDGIVASTKYLGDPKTADWVYQGEPLVYNGNVLLTMAPDSSGTVLATSDYMWYGNVKATLKTSRGPGVVTAFILLSDVKDEIDYEFVGTELDIAQTNYYFQGIPNYDNSANITTSDTYANFHTYEIQWTPDTITWLLDGKAGRTKKRSETWNSSANRWDYPQTPARVQISIWPAGSDKNAAGTVQWAGGPIDWNSEDIQNYGYDFATFGQIEVECFNTTSAPGTNAKTSYTYNDISATNNTVIDGDKPTVLKSFAGTGLDMNAGDPSGTSTASSTGAVASIPGGSVSGPGVNGQAAGDSGGASSTAAAAGCQTTGFTQSCGNSGGSKNDGHRVGGEHVLGASAFAVVIALAGVMVL